MRHVFKPAASRVSAFTAAPRIYLFFPAVVLKLVASAVSAVAFVQGSGILWFAGMVLWFFWLALLVAIALPETDVRLRRFVRASRASALSVMAVLALAGALELAGIFGVGLTDVQVNILGPNTGELLGALNHCFAYNDATALCHQAVDNAREGLNPYAEANIVMANLRFGNPYDKTTPLRLGRFADDFPYPRLSELDTVWSEAVKNPGAIPPEIESRLAYPAGCFLLPLPFIALGITDLRLVYLIYLVPVLAYLVIKAGDGLRWWLAAGIIGSLELLNSMASGETGILSLPFLLLAWLLWRRNLWLAALSLGVAATVKQTAWFFAPFFLILVLRNLGVKKAIIVAGIAGIVFFAFNLPYIWQEPRLWAASVLAPMSSSFFPLGVGIVALVSAGYWQLQNPLVFTGLEALAGVLCLAVYYLNCRRAPYLGIVLAVVPLMFAWRSLWSYFFYFDVILLAVIIWNEYGGKKPGQLPDGVSEKVQPAAALQPV